MMEVNTAAACPHTLKMAGVLDKAFVFETDSYLALHAESCIPCATELKQLEKTHHHLQQQIPFKLFPYEQAQMEQEIVNSLNHFERIWELETEPLAPRFWPRFLSFILTSKKLWVYAGLLFTVSYLLQNYSTR